MRSQRGGLAHRSLQWPRKSPAKKQSGCPSSVPIAPPAGPATAAPAEAERRPSSPSSETAEQGAWVQLLTKLFDVHGAAQQAVNDPTLRSDRATTLQGALQWLSSLLPHDDDGDDDEDSSPPFHYYDSATPSVGESRRSRRRNHCTVDSTVGTPRSQRRVHATLIRSNRPCPTDDLIVQGDGYDSQTSSMETLAYAPVPCSRSPAPPWPSLQPSALVAAASPGVKDAAVPDQPPSTAATTTATPGSCEICRRKRAPLLEPEKRLLAGCLPRGVCIFDLDDTLIPTEWVRRAYVVAKSQLYQEMRHGGGMLCDTSDLAVVKRVRQLMNASNCNLEAEAISVLTDALRIFGIVVLVTNARSVTWLRLVEHLFPNLRSRMRVLGIPLVRAVQDAEGANPYRTFPSVAEYFNYWSGLKQTQFSRVVHEAVVVRGAATTLDDGEDDPPVAAVSQESFETTVNTPETSSKNSISSNNKKCDCVRQCPENVNDVNDDDDDTANPTEGGDPPQGLATASTVRRLLAKSDSTDKFSDDTLKKVIEYQMWTYASNTATTAATTAMTATPLHKLPLSRRQSFAGSISSTTTSTSASFARQMEDSRQQQQDDDAAAGKEFASEEENYGYKIDLISIGDSEFELAAARRLAVQDDSNIRGLGLMRCKAGLPPDLFGRQLHDLLTGLKWFEQQQHRLEECERLQQHRKDMMTLSEEEHVQPAGRTESNLKRSYSKQQTADEKPTEHLGRCGALHISETVMSEWTDCESAYPTKTLGHPPHGIF